jgi:hypothetical protein
MICLYLQSRLFLFLEFSAAAFCSELFSLPLKGSERHSKSLLLFFPRNSDLFSHISKGS